VGKGDGLLESEFTQFCPQTRNVSKFRLQYKCGVDVCVEGVITTELSDVVVEMENPAPATTQFVESDGKFGVDVKIV
jgi:hypothetical protein